MARSSLPAAHPASTSQPGAREAHLQRRLGLPLIVLYGLGTTVGAGIYVLIGATANETGVHAPLAFLVAAAVMLPSACSFAEMVGRYPVSAGEAAYVRAGLKVPHIGLIVGLLVICAGTVSAATVTVGSIGYLQHLIPLPATILIPLVVILMSALAAWGILQSVAFAAALTVLELAGLLFVIGAGLTSHPELVQNLEELLPPLNGSLALTGFFQASLLAFFAFIGFEDLVNVAEETHAPAKVIPKAIFLTLGTTTLLYLAVSSIAVLTVPVPELGSSKAPLSFVFEELTGTSPALISLIAVIAALNGMIIQIIMASRIIYGLSKQGELPARLGAINKITHTPVIATALIGMLVLALALFLPLEGLAKTTSVITLNVFALVNVALLSTKLAQTPAPPGTFIVPIWVPVLGAAGCVFLLASGLM